MLHKEMSCKIGYEIAVNHNVSHKERTMDIERLVRTLPREIASILNMDKLGELREIRLRVNRKSILKYDTEIITDYIPQERDMINIVHMLCDNSIYSYQSQICNGFITIYGGHRVGITGNIAMKDGVITNINYISSLNFRIAKEISGASNTILNEIVQNNDINNTLIISKPGCGKTTIIRDIVKNISNMRIYSIINR